MDLIQIKNQLLDNINWQQVSACGFNVQNDVDIWRINISAHLGLLDEFQSIMLPDEIARANRYFQLKDKNRYIVSRGAMRNILGRYLAQKPADIRFGIGENKKPFIVTSGDSKLRYNLSHAGDWILLAVANFEVGADTEYIDPNFSYQEIIADNFSNTEVNFINETSSAARFFLLWTRKEALTKATGKGLDDALRQFPALDGSHFVPEAIVKSKDNWLISSLKIADSYWASVANNAMVNKLNFYDIDMNMLQNNLISG